MDSEAFVGSDASALLERTGRNKLAASASACLLVWYNPGFESYQRNQVGEKSLIAVFINEFLDPMSNSVLKVLKAAGSV